MPLIHPLDPHLINQISAGEVVERPASVLKELMENALDAGATHLTVRWRQGGQSLIEVEDNGCGIPRDQLALALARHATSKLRTQEDLSAISTFGFRGEALSAVASIARLTLTSRHASDAHAWALSVHGGQEIGCVPSNREKGTCVQVRDLFFATPARLKFMRSVALEQQHLWDVVHKMVLAHSEASFSVHSDTRVVEYGIGMEKRVRDVLGTGFFENAFYINEQRSAYGLTGWVGLPTHHRAAADKQFFFINARGVKDKILATAFRLAFGDTMPKGRHPVGALFLTVPLGDVDVNVHPAKTEVRFLDPRFVRGFVLGVLKEGVWKNGLRASSWSVATAQDPETSAHLSQDSGSQELDQTGSLQGSLQGSLRGPLGVSPPEQGADLGWDQAAIQGANVGFVSMAQPWPAQFPDTRPGPLQPPDCQSHCPQPLGVESNRDASPHQVSRKPNNLEPWGPVVEPSWTHRNLVAAAVHAQDQQSGNNVLKEQRPAEVSLEARDGGRGTADPTGQSDPKNALVSTRQNDPARTDQVQQGLRFRHAAAPHGVYDPTMAREDPYFIPKSTDSGALCFDWSIGEKSHHEGPILVDLGQALGQINDAYIVARSSAGLVLVDPHAAHERIVYERMKTQWADDLGAIQTFLLPMVWAITATEQEHMMDIANLMKTLGFEYELLDEQCRLKTVPMIFHAYDPEKLVRDLITCVQEDDGVQDIVLAWRNHMMANWSCRQSLKLGQHMTIDAMNHLLRTLERTPHGAQCNHGRCVYRLLGVKDLARMFDR